MNYRSTQTHPVPPQGFIALISAIIISTILLSVAATLDQGTFFARFDQLNGEYHTIAQSLTTACINSALLKLRDNYAYTVYDDPRYDATAGAVLLPLGRLYDQNTQCRLEGPTTTPIEINHTRTFTVTARGAFNNSFSRQRVEATVHSPTYPQGMVPMITLSHWHEVP